MDWVNFSSFERVGVSTAASHSECALPAAAGPTPAGCGTVFFSVCREANARTNRGEAMVSPCPSRHSSRTERHQRRRRRRQRWYDGERPVARRAAGAGQAPARTAGGSRAVVLMSFLMGVMACSCLLAVPAAAMSPNEAHDSNRLGLLAQSCAESFCGPGMNALDLWLSLEQVRKRWQQEDDL